MLIKENLVGVRVRVCARTSGVVELRATIRGLALDGGGFRFLLEANEERLDGYFHIREHELCNVHELDETVVVQVDPRFS